jgi:hypothetical protein
MSSSRFATRVATVCLQVLPLLLFVACQQQMAVPPKRPAEVPLPPKGPKAVQEVDKLLAKFEWGEGHDARCQGCAPGDVGIRPIGLTRDIKGSKGPDKRRIVALIENYSDQDVGHTLYSRTFKKNTRYLMFVEGRKSDGKAMWGFISLDSDYDPNTPPIGLLVNCPSHQDKPHSTIDDANFQDCDDPYPPRSASGWVKSAFAATTAAASISKPGWVSCDPDCCTGTTQQ